MMTCGPVPPSGMTPQAGFFERFVLAVGVGGRGVGASLLFATPSRLAR